MLDVNQDELKRASLRCNLQANAQKSTIYSSAKIGTKAPRKIHTPRTSVQAGLSMLRKIPGNYHLPHKLDIAYLSCRTEVNILKVGFMRSLSLYQNMGSSRTSVKGVSHLSSPYVALAQMNQVRV